MSGFYLNGRFGYAEFLAQESAEFRIRLSVFGRSGNCDFDRSAVNTGKSGFRSFRLNPAVYGNAVFGYFDELLSSDGHILSSTLLLNT